MSNVCCEHNNKLTALISKIRDGRNSINSEIAVPRLRLCEIPRSRPNPDQVSIKNCKQLFSQVLEFETKKIVRPSPGMMFVICPAITFIRNANSCEKSCLQFSIPTVVFHLPYILNQKFNSIKISVLRDITKI